MSLTANSADDATKYGDWLARCCEGFVERLATRGYASGTIRVYGRAVRALCTEAMNRSLDIRCLGATTVARLSELAPRNWVAPRSKQLWKTIVNRFVGYLAETGAVDPSNWTGPRQSGSRAQLRNEYRDWLCQQRGLSSATVKNNLTVFSAFMRFRFGDDTIRPMPSNPRTWSTFLRRSRPIRGPARIAATRPDSAICCGFCTGAGGSGSILPTPYRAQRDAVQTSLEPTSSRKKSIA